MCQDNLHHSVSTQVYQYLSETKGWWILKELCDENYKVVYLKGKPTENEDERIIIPALPHEKTDWRKLDYYFKIFNSLSLTLAIADCDSTMVFYEVTKGLHAPSPPEDIQSDLNDL